MSDQALWQLVREHARAVVADAAPPFISYGITTGDPITTETVAGVTTNQVTVWLDGLPQIAENKRNVTLPFGVAAPGAGELWLVLLPNYTPPGVLLLRTA